MLKKIIVGCLVFTFIGCFSTKPVVNVNSLVSEYADKFKAIKYENKYASVVGELPASIYTCEDRFVLTYDYAIRLMAIDPHIESTLSSIIEEEIIDGIEDGAVMIFTNKDNKSITYSRKGISAKYLLQMVDKIKAGRIIRRRNQIIYKIQDDVEKKYFCK